MVSQSADGSAIKMAEHHRVVILVIGVLNVLVSVLSVGHWANAADEAKPRLTVILEQNELLADRSLELRVWVENPTNFRMMQINLRFSGPEYIKIGKPGSAGDCNAVQQDSPLLLGALSPHSVLDPPTRLCLKADNAVEERDINVAFSITYMLTQSTRPETGIAISDKKVSVSLFGNDNVAGVSVRLATYFVPGMLLLMILRLGSIPFVEKLTSTDAAMLSVLTSVMLSFVTPWLLGTRQVYLQGASSAISINLFLIVCASAAFVGVAVIIIARACRYFRHCSLRRREALLVDAEDPTVSVLLKALRSSKGTPWPAPVMMVTTDQVTFVGSLSAWTRDGGVALVGWFELRAATNDALEQKLRNLLNSGQYERAVKLAQANNLQLQTRNTIRRSSGGQLRASPDVVRRFAKNEICENTRCEIAGLDVQDPPIILA